MTKIECLICGNTWTKHQFEAEAVDYFGGDRLPDMDDGWCPSCGEKGAAYEVCSSEWKAEHDYHGSVRSLARAEFEMAGRPEKSYREYHKEARRDTA